MVGKYEDQTLKEDVARLKELSQEFDQAAADGDGGKMEDLTDEGDEIIDRDPEAQDVLIREEADKVLAEG